MTDATSSSPGQISLQLAGMTCAGCAQHIEHALSHVQGVTTAQVNFATHTAWVTGEANPQALILAVQHAGYQATLSDEDNLEYEHTIIETAQMQLKLKQAAVCFALALPLLINSLIEFIPKLNSSYGTGNWFIVGLLTFIALAYAAKQIFQQGIVALKTQRATMESLVALGVGSAWLYSMYVVLFPNTLPLQAQTLYFETALLITAFIDFGGALETRARGKTAQAIRRLSRLSPKTARVIRAQQEIEIPVFEIVKDDLIRIRPGDRIPVDGKVTQGNSYVDESMLTGESAPSHKQAGDPVFAGTINKLGSFDFCSTRIGQETILAQIIDLVKQAQNSKPPIARLVDQITAYFVPAVLIIALLTACLWLFFGPAPKISYMLATSMAVLVIACPCALGLGTPLAVIAGIGKAAEYGILTRSSEALQRMGKITTLVVDKTGTLTTGVPTVTSINTFSDWDENTLLHYAASVEAHSEHPIAQAIMQKAKERELVNFALENFSAEAGLGISAHMQGEMVWVGNQHFMEAQHINCAIADHQSQLLRRQGRTIVFVATSGKLRGIIGIHDPIRKEALPAMQQLRELGIRVVMLTGDHRTTAFAVAKELSIDDFQAEIMPAEKLHQIQIMQERGEIVGMVGDGINDAPALSQAHIGLAMGSGTDIAISVSDITLLRHNLTAVPQAIAISRATMRNIKENLFGAFLYNTLSIPIAAGILYPWFEWLFPPMLAGLTMAASSLTVVLNANRLRSYKP